MSASGLRQAANQQLELTSFLYSGNAPYIEKLHAIYAADPMAVEPEWREFFDSLNEEAISVQEAVEGPSWKRSNWPVAIGGELTSSMDGNWAPDVVRLADHMKADPPQTGDQQHADRSSASLDSIRAMMMVQAYRSRGHFHADLDPLGLKEHVDNEELKPSAYGFTEADSDRKILVDGTAGMSSVTIVELVEKLRARYCSTIGYEFLHLSNAEQVKWLQERIEAEEPPVGRDMMREILKKLVEVKGYERYLDKKFVGTTRFGLDGAEATILALEEIIRRGAALGVSEVVLGMAHRGRLNVLSQVMMKPHRAIFSEFKGGSFLPDEVQGSGDVKYHLGASSDREYNGQTVHLSLTANPSHLEISDPVVLGKVRAKQDQHEDVVDRTSVLPLLIHGDAAFAGQGVVAECFALSGLKGYRTGGSLHFIINNQIGFTTDPGYSRSSPYPSDVTKMIDAPIFHVNGDDPEAVLRVARIAIEFRQTFHKPAVIDMFCFRLYGHNEGDEPAFTQPRMYKKVRAHKSTLEIYAERVVAEGTMTREEIDKASADWTSHLDAEFEAGLTYRPNKADWLDGPWTGLRASAEVPGEANETGIDIPRLRAVGARLTEVPEGFEVHPTVQRFLDNRRKSIEAGEGVDWATAEALALGTLLDEGCPVRLAGQDSERGTFSQRHAVLIDQNSEERYRPLASIRDGQAKFEIINSPLSEEAVLAFEYGYTLAEPKALVMWEAQFGDFANGAQVVFDQFISSGERKWLRMSGLVCLLPHGYDGQGPEHSSARLERYLQSSAEDNWQVANCTTPANYFHILRRQMKRDFRKPLILMTPKSLLRHRLCRSSLAELAEGSGFQHVLKDGGESGAQGAVLLAADEKMRRVLICSGKVYYTLFEEREKRGVDDVYLLRVEQLYPVPAKPLMEQLERFKNADVVWCQEEPRNMGAWDFMGPHLETVLTQVGGRCQRACFVGRPASASTAVGVMSQHVAQLKAIMDEAFAS
ncbi:2-oxoglutarate dehydrogenase E1 component [Tardiphaga robiniae]|uniref:2-oxoglutarate dehydrogenase E1 component n=1 Tax=Tardiphaga robiniae TaxID=943830 RepID=A0A7G6TU15_9BRAD|nr:2-oxoglutarate dehydrogenase E1 component [Tardiphaga robiniae]QND70247.1 2-oxoglutarate dehydrogenase E1 component [Tardiphaga robiniae]